MNKKDLKEFLDEKVKLYNRKKFIEDDPISVPHKFSLKEDIEITAFLTSIIAWGNRKMIIRNADMLVHIMDMAPHDFLMNAQGTDLKKFSGFTHRTFNGTDCIYFISALQSIYRYYGGLENAFAPRSGEMNMKESISRFRQLFLSLTPPDRTRKHISDPAKNSACKRINMFLRWMVRSDKASVDFGLWKKFHDPGLLLCPLDVHSGRVARALGLLDRKQDDWKSVEVLTEALVNMDSKDPVKYDFALFGLGVNEKFK